MRDVIKYSSVEFEVIQHNCYNSYVSLYLIATILSRKVTIHNKHNCGTYHKPSRLYVHVCMYTRIHARMYTRMYTSMYTRMYTLYVFKCYEWVRGTINNIIPVKLTIYIIWWTVLQWLWWRSGVWGREWVWVGSTEVSSNLMRYIEHRHSDITTIKTSLDVNASDHRHSDITTIKTTLDINAY